jgi:hypothetical protein
VQTRLNMISHIGHEVICRRGEPRLSNDRKDMRAPTRCRDDYQLDEERGTLRGVQIERAAARMSSRRSRRDGAAIGNTFRLRESDQQLVAVDAWYTDVEGVRHRVTLDATSAAAGVANLAAALALFASNDKAATIALFVVLLATNRDRDRQQSC